MNKVIVIGCSGAGKSTFARKLRDKTNLPLFYLDQIWHKPDKTNITRDEFDKKLFEILDNNESWIIDGNYIRTLETRLKECDTVFFFDLSVEECLEGVKSRIGKSREDMPWVEEEFDEEFMQWIINFPKDQLPIIYDLLDKYQNKNIYIFKTRLDATNYLNRL